MAPRLGLLPAMLAIVACSGPAVEAPSSEVPASRRMTGRSLVGWVPEGADWLVRARPRAFFDGQISAVVAQAMLPEALLDRIGRQSGVELDELDELVYCRFGNGWLLLLRGPWAAAEVVEANAIRMHPVEVRAQTPYPRLTGWIGTRRIDLVAVDDRTLLVAEAAPQAVSALLYPEREGTASPSASWERFERLADVHRKALASVLLPVPLEVPPQEGPPSGVALLLARQEQLAMSLYPPDDDSPAGSSAALRLSVELLGTFPDNAAENFRAWVASLAASDLGRAIGIDPGVRGLTVQTRPDGVSLALWLPAHSLASTLRAMFGATLAEAIDGV